MKTTPRRPFAPLSLHRETLNDLDRMPTTLGAKALGTHYETICEPTCDTQTNNAR